MSERSARRGRATFAVAIAASIALHLALAGAIRLPGPSRAPSPDPASGPILARLLPPSPEAPAALTAGRPGTAVASAPKRPPAGSTTSLPTLSPLAGPEPRTQGEHATGAAAPLPEAVAAGPVTPEANRTAQTPDAPTPALGADPPPLATPAIPQAALATLPARGRLDYSISTGSPAMPVGRATYLWQAGEGRYRLELAARTSGLVGLFRPAEARQWSEGELDQQGLRPLRFHLDRGDGRAPETATFDWSRRRIAFGRTGEQKDAPLAAGTQDALSLMLHLAFAPPTEGRRELWLVTGRSLHLQAYAAAGAQALETPAGSFRVVHLRRETAGDDAEGYDLWLAEDRPWLPVRIRWTDRRGRITEAVLDTFDLPSR